MTIEDIGRNGIVGAGGAGFPTHVKLKARPEFFIMNAAECEPLLHKDMELLRHHAGEILAGMQTAMAITGAQSGIIGIKEKHDDVITLLSKKLPDNIRIITIGDFYPAGDEVVLVHLTTGRVIQPGKLPASVGCLVQNVETLFNIHLNRPVTDKYISVAGSVKNPATIKVPVGTTYGEVLSRFQITSANFKVRAGGLMMGELAPDLNQVITKRTGALIVLPADHPVVNTYELYATEHDTDRLAKASCDQCNFCTELCPRYLLGYPVRPETAMRNRMFAQDEEPVLHVGNAFCCECNLCTLYACPEGLDPKGATLIEKKLSFQQEEKWEGFPVVPHPMSDYRKVPTKKLMQRLDVLRFKDEGPLQNILFEPEQVRIPLLQHVGAPAKPVVSVGDRVKKYDLIAEADGTISTNLHASIDGEIVSISEKDIIIRT